jgi:hypothetical protein
MFNLHYGKWQQQMATEKLQVSSQATGVLELNGLEVTLLLSGKASDPHGDSFSCQLPKRG